MELSVIDTLRYADRLKAAGVEARQAEAMSRALNDELAGGVATKRNLDDAAGGIKHDLDQAVGELRHDLDQAVGGLRHDLDQAVGGLKHDLDQAVGDLRHDLDQAVGELRGEIGKVDAKVDSKFDALDSKFDALSGRFETQGRYTFLVLALIAALGLFNAVTPHLDAAAPQTSAETAQSARG